MQKIRGSLHVAKNLQLPEPLGTSPQQGKIAVSDEHGNIFWGHISVLALTAEVYPKAGTLVIHQGALYFSLVDTASGQDIENTEKWMKSGGQDGTLLTSAQVAALDGASNPGSGNPFATIGDIQNFSIEGSDTVAAIVLKSFSTRNRLWLSTTAGIDTFGTAVVAGDGLVSTGLGWKNIGPFRGPIGLTGQGVPGEQGPPGAAPSTYVYPQTVAAETWVIPHNLNKYPSVTIVNLGRSTIESTVNYVDENNIVVTVYPMSAGFAYLN